MMAYRLTGSISSLAAPLNSELKTRGLALPLWLHGPSSEEVTVHRPLPAVDCQLSAHDNSQPDAIPQSLVFDMCL